MTYTVVIPNHYEDIIQPLVDSINKYETDPKVLIVSDRHERDYGFSNITISYNPFIFSKAANAGISAAIRDDIILTNDDVRLTQPTFNQLHDIAYSDPSIGILSPLINGGCGNAYMMPAYVNKLWNGQSLIYREGTGSDYLSFVCVYIKRSLINHIGLMDENFTHYGRDDADMCIRAVQAGWKIAITRSLTVDHGEGGHFFARGKNWNSSYHRVGISKNSEDYFHIKYPNEPRRPTWPHPFSIRTSPLTLGPNNWKQRLELHSKIERSQSNG